jgi:hypothetical protein
VPTANINSVVFYGTSSGNLDQRAAGVATSYAYDYRGNGTAYASPVLHHVLLKGKYSLAQVSPADQSTYVTA